MQTQSEYQPQYASFMQRFAAFIIDNIFLLIVFTPLIPLITGPEYQAAREAVDSALTALSQAQTPEAITEANIQLQTALNSLLNEQPFILVQVITLLITVIFWLRFAGTPGKRLLGMKVLEANTLTPLKPIPATLRYLGYFLSFFPLGLGFLWIIFDKNNQGWHDKLANSVVVIEKSGRQKRPQSRPTSENKKSDEEFFEA